MIFRQFLAHAAVLAVILIHAGAARAAGPVLTLEDAVRLALNMADPAFTRLDARAEALREQAVADAQLPDPEITGSLSNVPTNTFRFDQDNMTQIRFGLRQRFPAGNTLAIRGEQRSEEAEVALRRKALELERTRLEVRRAWFNLFYHEQALRIIQNSHDAVKEQVDSLTARFATGRLHAQDMLRVDLELALLEDQITEHGRQADLQRAGLARYIRDNARRPLPDSLPQLPAPPPVQAIEAKLVEHPSVAVEDTQARVAEHDIRLAEQTYKPAWTLDGGYAVRKERPDQVSIGATLSIPLFTGMRQDRRFAAAVKRHSAELLDRDLLLLELRRDLHQAWADWQRLRQRVELYREVASERARQTADASLTTYANNQTDFAELIRSRLAELDVELNQVELETEAARAWARLMYLNGGES